MTRADERRERCPRECSEQHTYVPSQCAAAVKRGSWYDDAPITDEQIESVRRDLELPVAERGAAFAPFVVRKLLAEVDQLRAERAPLADTELDEIRQRNDYLLTVPFETHGPSVVHSDGCPPCGMVRSIGDVTRLLAALDDAQKQLAEHKPGPVLRAWRGDNGDIIHGEKTWIRQAIRTHGGQHVIANTCSHVSGWREAEQEGDRG